ncbi:8991_t:CDS:1, partial [Paraglomus occultum]
RSDSVQDELIVIQQDDRFDMNDHDEFLYHVGKLKEIIKTKFGADQENLPEHIRFTVDIELEEELIDQQSVMDHKSDRQKQYYNNLIGMIVTLLEDGSRYYWEIRKVYYGEKNNVHNGVVTAFLRCTQRND